MIVIGCACRLIIRFIIDFTLQLLLLPHHTPALTCTHGSYRWSHHCLFSSTLNFSAWLYIYRDDRQDENLLANLFPVYLFLIVLGW